MNESQFSKEYGLLGPDLVAIRKFAFGQTQIPVKKSFGSFSVNDEDAQKLFDAWIDDRLSKGEQRAVEIVKRREEERQLEEERLRMQEEQKLIFEVAATMPITSTAGFDGYRIVEYGGYVSGDEVVMLSDSLFSMERFNKDSINNKIKDVRVVAINELKAAAAQLGCNAVVGLDFDYVTIDRQRPAALSGNPVNETFVILTANGTAVTIEPE